MLTSLRNGSNPGVGIAAQLLGRLKDQLKSGNAGTQLEISARHAPSAAKMPPASALPSFASHSGVPLSSILHGGVSGRPQDFTSTTVSPLPPPLLVVVVPCEPPAGAVTGGADGVPGSGAGSGVLPLGQFVTVSRMSTMIVGDGLGEGLVLKR